MIRSHECVNHASRTGLFRASYNTGSIPFIHVRILLSSAESPGWLFGRFFRSDKESKLAEERQNVPNWIAFKRTWGAGTFGGSTRICLSERGVIHLGHRTEPRSGVVVGGFIKLPGLFYSMGQFFPCSRARFVLYSRMLLQYTAGHA